MDGEKLKTARTRALMTLRQLETASGVPFLTIHRIEAGKVKRARPSTVKRLATALKVDPLELMSEVNDAPTT
jgi:transcriptional regulator with XRE-family HTH domain